MKQFYFHDGQNEVGPLDLEQLKLHPLKKDTPIWHEGLEGWITAVQVEELKSLFISKPVPPALEKSAPPKFEQKTVDFPLVNPKKHSGNKTKTAIIIIAAIIITGSIIGWLIYKNSENASTIDALQEQVSTQESAIQEQQKNEAENEAERQRINAAITEKNMKYRNNWENYIKVQNSEPSIDYTLGGISEFNVYVSNETTYLIDQADVHIQYIRKNGNIAQEKTISLFNIPPGQSEAGIAPSSINGVKVVCTITKVISKKMHFCYPSDSGNPDDPFFCK